VTLTGQWFSPGTPVSSTNKTNCHDIAEILLKVALNTISQKPDFTICYLLVSCLPVICSLKTYQILMKIKKKLVIYDTLLIQSN
jgi:hypothetical protein